MNRHIRSASLAAVNATPIPVRYLVEGNCDPAVYSSLDSVAADIASGQIEDVHSVLEILEDESSVRNVTEDCARLVLEKSRGEPLRYSIRNFCHEHLGVYSC